VVEVVDEVVSSGKRVPLPGRADSGASEDIASAALEKHRALVVRVVLQHSTGQITQPPGLVLAAVLLKINYLYGLDHDFFWCAG